MNQKRYISLFLFCLLSGFQLFAQNSLEFYQEEIGKLNGVDKINKYIKAIEELKTRTPQSSIKLAEKALEYISKSKFPKKFYHVEYLLGDTYYLTGEYEDALHYLLDAAENLEQLNDNEILPQVYISIGRIYRKVQNNCNKAKDYYQKVEKIYEKTNNIQELATVHNYLGNIAQSCDKDYETALSYYNRTLQYYTEKKDSIGLSYSLDFISQVKGEQKDYSEAIEMQKRALDIRSILKDSFAIAISYTNLGELYSIQNKILDSKKNFIEALKIADNQNYNDIKSYLLENLSSLSYQSGDYAEAYNYLKIQSELKNKLLDEDKNKQLTEMQVKYETQKKELALSEALLKNRNKTILLIALISAIVLLSVIVALLMQRRKLEQQQAAINRMKALEEERLRISRDLHDNLGAELTLITSKLDMKSYKSESENDKREIEAIRKISSNANNALRETIWSIHKQHLNTDELGSKIFDYAQKMFEGKDVAIKYTLLDQRELAPATALHLYRIAQETINNASKYAQCKELNIELGAHQLCIADNGTGFEWEHSRKGYGLQNIQDRVEQINGQIDVVTSEKKGTKYTITFNSSATQYNNINI